LDYLFSIVGIVPWRCEQCEGRFHSRSLPFRFWFYAHCGICGNLDLQKISPEYVPGPLSFAGRLMRLPALRCEPCRNKFFTVRPLYPEALREVVPSSETDQAA
jgi:hypothetical protein